MTVAICTPDQLFDDVVNSFRNVSPNEQRKNFCNHLLTFFHSNTKVGEVVQKYKKYQFQNLTLEYSQEMRQFIQFLESQHITFVPQ